MGQKCVYANGTKTRILVEENFSQRRARNTADFGREKGHENAHADLSELVFGRIDHVSRLCIEEDNFRDWYRKTAGMHTVQHWLENYHKHPSGWGALIMLMGAPEVCQTFF